MLKERFKTRLSRSDYVKVLGYLVKNEEEAYHFVNVIDGDEEEQWDWIHYDLLLK